MSMVAWETLVVWMPEEWYLDCIEPCLSSLTGVLWTPNRAVYGHAHASVLGTVCSGDIAWATKLYYQSMM